MSNLLKTCIVSLLSGLPFLLVILYVTYTLDKEHVERIAKFACYDKCDKEIFDPCYKTPSWECVEAYKVCNESCK